MWKPPFACPPREGGGPPSQTRLHVVVLYSPTHHSERSPRSEESLCQPGSHRSAIALRRPSRAALLARYFLPEVLPQSFSLAATSPAPIVCPWLASWFAPPFPR